MKRKIWTAVHDAAADTDYGGYGRLRGYFLTERTTATAKERQCRGTKAGMGRETLSNNIIKQDVNARLGRDLTEALTL